MLYRTIAADIEKHLNSKEKPVLLVDGARQIGKTYIIRYVGQKLFANFVEVNMVEDSLGDRLFDNIKSVEDFYFKLSSVAGDKLKDKENTLVFLDEIQVYPKLLSLLKFLVEDNRFTYIASGSLLGVTLSETTSIPMGSIKKIQMYPLSFEEFLYANGFGKESIENIKAQYDKLNALDESMHSRMIDLFKKYLVIGGMPAVVNEYINSKNIQTVRALQKEIIEYYKSDASKYDEKRKLQIRRIYEMIPSNMENKKKRVVIKDIEGKKGKVQDDYADEFEYIINSGIALCARAVSNPVFPLLQSSAKNLLKLYLNDVGLLTALLYGNNVNAILDSVPSINMGSVYETVVAMQLAVNHHDLYYYDNRKKGEVDFLIDDYNNLSILPIEIKSGKDYTIHHALNTFAAGDYNMKRAYVLSNDRNIVIKEKIIYLPIYYSMFI